MARTAFRWLRRVPDKTNKSVSITEPQGSANDKRKGRAALECSVHREVELGGHGEAIVMGTMRVVNSGGERRCKRVEEISEEQSYGHEELGGGGLVAVNLAR
jgi:hypothetical protein